MSAATAHTAIVLAAGGSHRLGYPKQLLRRDGETLVHRAVRLAWLTRPQRLLLICGGYAEEVRTAVSDLRTDIVLNRDWQEGLAGTVRLAVEALGERDLSALVLGCDQPALEYDHLRRLLAGAAASISGCAATLHAGRPGIPAVVSAVLLRQARDLRGDSGLRGPLQRLPSGSLYLLDAGELQFDLDTAEDVEKARDQELLDRL